MQPSLHLYVTMTSKKSHVLKFNCVRLLAFAVLSKYFLNTFRGGGGPYPVRVVKPNTCLHHLTQHTGVLRTTFLALSQAQVFIQLYYRPAAAPHFFIFGAILPTYIHKVLKKKLRLKAKSQIHA